MFRRILNIGQYLIFLGAGLFLVWWQLRSMTDEEMRIFFESLRRADYLMMVPILIMGLLAHLSRSMRWKLMMEPLGYHPALKNVFAVTMAGYLANAAVPRLGEVLKCSLLAKYEKLRIDKLVGTIIVERIFDLLCFGIFIALTLTIQLDRLGHFIDEKMANAGYSHSGALIRIAVMLLLVTIGYLLLRALYKRFPENAFFARIRNAIEGFSEGIRSIRNLKKIRAFLAHTLFIWTMYLLQIYIGFFAMKETAGLSFGAACSVLTLATFAMILTPGGIGSFPVFVMQTLVLYHISQPVGNAFGWLVWGVNTGIIVLAGLASMILLPIINKTNHHETSASHTG